MGYYMSQWNTRFFIPAEYKANALQAIKYLAQNEPSMRGKRRQSGKKVETWLSWVDMAYLQDTTLYKALEKWRWTPAENEAGDIIDIRFDGEKLGDEALLFDALAPFVREGSYIEMHGEDETWWRWWFHNGGCHEVTPTILWGEGMDGEQEA